MMIEINYHVLRELEKSGKKCQFAIGKGANDVYFTLWKMENVGMVGDNMQVYCAYSQNLSQDKEKAMESYKKITDEDNALFVPFLSGDTIKFESIIDFAGYFVRGKYTGKHITDVDYEYLRFCVDNGNGGKLLAKYFESLPEKPKTSIIDFGKYAGLTIDDIAKKDTDYLFWLCENCSKKLDLSKYFDGFKNSVECAYMSNSKFASSLAKKNFKKMVAELL